MSASLLVEVRLHSIFAFSTRWTWVVSITPPAALLLREGLLYPVDMWLTGPQSMSGQWQRKKSQLLQLIEPQLHSCPAHSAVIY
jgi:hypothetical protein